VGKVFGKKAAVQRCHWHKRENVLGYLPAGLQPVFKRKLQAAYGQPTCAAAKAALKRVRAELVKVNASAVGSLDEGLGGTKREEGGVLAPDALCVSARGRMP